MGIKIRNPLRQQDKRMNMHFQFRIRLFTAQTGSEIHNLRKMKMRRARIRAAGRREKRNGEKVGSVSVGGGGADAAEEKHPRFLKYLLHFLFFPPGLNHSQSESSSTLTPL